MDPSKRLILKNLPPGVTKKDIADFVKGRSRAQPRGIDLGVNEDGTTRRYAHITVDGLKAVIAALADASFKGYPVKVEPARPHYTWKIQEDKRRREQEQEEELQKASTIAETLSSEPILRRNRAPKPDYMGKQRYARVASEIASQLRQEYYRKNGHHAGPQQLETTTRLKKKRRIDANQSTAPGADQPTSCCVTPKAPQPPPPPQPSKEEKKLQGLQARLAALKERMK